MMSLVLSLLLAVGIGLLLSGRPTPPWIDLDTFLLFVVGWALGTLVHDWGHRRAPR